MTIYDSDYVAEQELQSKYTGVTDSAAGDQEAISEQPLDQVGDNTEMVEDTTGTTVEAEQPVEHDKEYNFRAMREEIAKMKAEKEALEQNFDLWKRDLAANNVRREPEAPRKSALDTIPDDDIVTGAQLKRLLAEKDVELKKNLQEQEIYNQEMRVKSMYSDYDEVATKYGIPLMRKEPELAQAFVGAQNKAAYLYKLGKMAQLSESPQPQPSNIERQTVNRAQRLVENSRKPGTLSNSPSGQIGISKTDYFANMPESEFNELIKKHLEQV